MKPPKVCAVNSKNFWLKLKKPILALAPMAGVTDSAFRQICKSFGAGVVYSEMISATAIVYNSKKTLELIKFDKKERPFVVQLFGSKPGHFAYAVKFITKKIPARLMGGRPDGLDINFGCPVKKVAKQGAGAALMENYKLARLIIKATIDNTNLPVSIKIRAQVGKTTALDFLKHLNGLDIKAVMIHGRTLAQGHAGEVNWKIIKQARKYFGGIILANGGVKDKKTAEELLDATGADGVGIGQGALGRPWIFEEVKSLQPSSRQNDWHRSVGRVLKGDKKIFKIMLKHAELAEKLKGREGIIEMRKHLCRYVSGMENASELRRELVKVESLAEVKKILQPLFLFK